MNYGDDFYVMNSIIIYARTNCKVPDDPVIFNKNK